MFDMLTIYLQTVKETCFANFTSFKSRIALQEKLHRLAGLLTLLRMSKLVKIKVTY